MYHGVLQLLVIKMNQINLIWSSLHILCVYKNKILYRCRLH